MKRKSYVFEQLVGTCVMYVIVFNAYSIMLAVLPSSLFRRNYNEKEMVFNCVTLLVFIFVYLLYAIKVPRRLNVWLTIFLSLVILLFPSPIRVYTSRIQIEMMSWFQKSYTKDVSDVQLVLNERYPSLTLDKERSKKESKRFNELRVYIHNTDDKEYDDNDIRQLLSVLDQEKGSIYFFERNDFYIFQLDAYTIINCTPERTILCQRVLHDNDQ